MKQTIIFPHVPKAGGTSIKVQLQQSGLNVLMDYRAPPGNNPWHRQRHRIRIRQLQQIDIGNYDLVFGHFPISRYLGPQYRYVALVRDPVERAISEYHYQISRVSKPHLKPQWRALFQKMADGEIGFFDYCRRRDCGKVYRMFLNRWPRDRFVLVGDTAAYSEFLQGFNQLTGTKLSPGVQLLKREETGRTIPEEDIARLRVLLKDEIAWYRQIIGAS